MDKFTDLFNTFPWAATGGAVAAFLSGIGLFVAAFRAGWRMPPKQMPVADPIAPVPVDRSGSTRIRRMEESHDRMESSLDRVEELLGDIRADVRLIQRSVEREAEHTIDDRREMKDLLNEIIRLVKTALKRRPAAPRRPPKGCE